MASEVFLPKEILTKIPRQALLRQQAMATPLTRQVRRGRGLPWVAGGLKVKRKGLYAILGDIHRQPR